MIGGVTIREIIQIGGLPQLAGFPAPPLKQALNLSKVVPGITGP